MCLRYADIERLRDIEHDCYLTHPNRNEDTDDMALDAANQLDMGRKDFVAWLTSSKSWAVLDEANDIELDVSDFLKELNPYYG